MNIVTNASANTRRATLLAMGIFILALVAVTTSRINTASAADGDISLTPGWNLVGWAAPDTAIEAALRDGGVIDRVNAVWGYTDGTWAAFFPSAASVPGANDLTTFVHYGGYFIGLSAGDDVVWHTGAATATSTPSPTPPPTESPTATSTPTPVPSATVTADHGSYYIDSLGDAWVVGEVHNGLSVPVEFVQVTANFYLGSNLVGTETSYADLTAIPPDGTSSFSVLETEPQTFDSVKYSVTDYDTDGYEPVVSGLDAFVTNTYVDSIDFTHVIGSVTNNSAQTYQFVEVFVASYDAAGDVVGIDSTFAAPDTLAPGQAGTFEALSNVGEYSGAVVSRRLFIDASLP